METAMVRLRPLIILLVAVTSGACERSVPPPPPPLYPETVLLPLYAIHNERAGVYYVTLLGSPAFATVRDPDVALAHFVIEINPSFEATLIDSDEQPLPNQYGWLGSYSFDVAGGPLVIDVEIDGQAHTLTVGQTTYSLEEGNCIRIAATVDRAIVATQLERFLVDDPSNFDPVLAVFSAGSDGP